MTSAVVLALTAADYRTAIALSEEVRRRVAERGTNDLVWMTGGPQGSGIDSAANIFAQACVLSGLWSYGSREYYSNIKGLHSYFEIRVSDKPVSCKVDSVGLLATFDPETLARHADAVRPGGGIVYDPEYNSTEVGKIETIEGRVAEEISSRLRAKNLPSTMEGLLQEAQGKGVGVYPFPYEELVAEVGKKIGQPQISRLSKIVNVLAVSASLALLGLDSGYVVQSIKRSFKEKPGVIDMNTAGASVAYQYASDRYRGGLSAKLSPQENSRRLLLMGNEAVAMGKMVGGCRMQAYYPITPASDESEFLESHEVFDVIGGTADGGGSVLVVQTEDELAAITMATGATLTGTRASTSTSGPGFCLMVEGLGWAGMNEAPVVVTLYSRGGPATGLPTRTEQGDLKFVLNAAHGEFPRIVLCSGDIQECFYDAIRAFNYAETFQTPVIHMVDKALANSTEAVPFLDPSLVRLERGKLLLNGSEGKKGETYKRFAYADDGVSPRAVLGSPGRTFWNAGDEHDESGHIDEDPDNRVRMMTKRMKKLETAAKAIPEDVKTNFFAARKENPDLTIVSWGSPKGAILEAMDLLRADGIDAEFLQVRVASPFPRETVRRRLSGRGLVVAIEQNYSGQMAAVIAEQANIDIRHRVVKFNGRPISRDEVCSSAKAIVADPGNNERVVLTGGP